MLQLSSLSETLEPNPKTYDFFFGFRIEISIRKDYCFCLTERPIFAFKGKCFAFNGANLMPGTHFCNPLNVKYSLVLLILCIIKLVHLAGYIHCNSFWQFAPLTVC